MLEKRNVFLATPAAARYFRKLYGDFNSWTLSAACNMGEAGLQRRMEDQECRDFYHLYLPQETERYIFPHRGREIHPHPFEKIGVLFRAVGLLYAPRSGFIQRLQSLLYESRPLPEAVRTTEDIVYVVKTGDALSMIADKYGVSMPDIMKWNNLRSGRGIHPGMKLRIIRVTGGAGGGMIRYSSPAHDRDRPVFGLHGNAFFCNHFLP